MARDHLGAEVLSLPQIREWTELSELVSRGLERSNFAACNFLAAAACAVGGNEGQTRPVRAALCCLLLSIKLIDDLLDQDPRGEHHHYGTAQVSNFALALQAASVCLASKIADPTCRAEIQTLLAQTALTTSLGQARDVRMPASEGEYWKVVEAKSTPLFAAAIKSGALLGGAGLQLADRLFAFGKELGTMIQINDDLADVFQSTPTPDWRTRTNNLPLLYAMSMEHPKRSRLVELMGQIERPAALAEAQGILVGCGAASYCAYRLVESRQRALGMLKGLMIPNPGVLTSLVDRQMEPVRRLLNRIGARPLEELIG
jgi:geranylgeranyl pyrophosphate synthase